MKVKITMITQTQLGNRVSGVHVAPCKGLVGCCVLHVQHASSLQQQQEGEHRLADVHACTTNHACWVPVTCDQPGHAIRQVGQPAS
jgi:hypothetical protein